MLRLSFAVYWFMNISLQKRKNLLAVKCFCYGDRSDEIRFYAKFKVCCSYSHLTCQLFALLEEHFKCWWKKRCCRKFVQRRSSRAYVCRCLPCAFSPRLCILPPFHTRNPLELRVFRKQRVKLQHKKVNYLKGYKSINSRRWPSVLHHIFSS